jgi:secernin
MCDTITLKGETCTLLAKNSDRHTRESQYIWYAADPFDECRHPELLEDHSSYSATSWKELQQVLERYDHPYPALISTPSWMWGAEMGVNTQGVAIASEPVFSNSRASYQQSGLLGDDILRIALHNSATAALARDQIIDLIVHHGQGGSSGYLGKLHHHSTYLITDAQQTIILESAGSHWAWKQVHHSTSLSDCYSLRSDYDRSDQMDLPDDFKGSYQDLFHSRMVKGDYRLAYTRSAIYGRSADLDTARSIMRSHITAYKHSGVGSICMHPDPISQLQTTSSMIVGCSKETGISQAWATCAPCPCSAIYLPLPVPASESSLPLLEERGFPVGRAAGKRFAARARHIAPKVAALHRRHEDVRTILAMTDRIIDEKTLGWETLSWENAVDIAEICYTACNAAYAEIAHILGARYDERYQIGDS